MKLEDAAALVQHPGIGEQVNARWADLGCGTGLFTFALAGLLQRGSHIYAVGKDNRALQKQANPNQVNIDFLQMDFTKAALPFNDLDGILMANALHFVSGKPALIDGLGKHLKNEGVFLLVEYDTDKPNPWVPYPASRRSLQTIFANAGYKTFVQLGTMPSVYNTASLYAALIKR